MKHSLLFSTAILLKSAIASMGLFSKPICIGIAFAKMEMKIIAAHLLRNYDWEILPNQIETVLVPSNSPKDGLRVRFKPQ